MDTDWRSFGKFHRWLLERTGGRFFDTVGSGRKVLLLTTTGRKSGEARTTPLVFMPFEDGYVVYASNGGQERPPAWWLNLQAMPDAEVQIRGRRVPVRAAEATEQEHAVIWPQARSYNDHWREYAEHTKRPIPLVVLRPR